MPPKRPKTKASEEPDGAAIAKPVSARKPKAKAAPRAKKGPWKMPPPLPAGEVLIDFGKKEWVIGSSIGKGGFGEIYLAGPQGSRASAETAKYVVKIEPHENGPLFTELSFYRRIAKAELIEKWVQDHKLKFLAIPKYISSGCHTRGAVKYRFMVMEHFGEDIEKKFTLCGRRFDIKSVCHLSLRLLEALEYLHEWEYVHADIKGSNLLTGHGASQENEVYLVDYGLAYRFNPEGRHKEYKEDPKRTHDGTIEFTSIDAHKGASPSRRGDLEILGYCLLQWACGRLPWEDNLENKPYVATQKISYKSNVEGLMEACFKDSPPLACLKEYMKYVYKLGYKEGPDYKYLKSLFLRELSSRRMKDDGKGLDWVGTRKRKSSDESKGSSPRKKQKRAPATDREGAVVVREKVAAKTARSKKAKAGKEVVRPQQQPGGRRVSREAEVEVDDSPVEPVRRGRKRKLVAALQLSDSDSDSEKAVQSPKTPVRGRKRAAVLQRSPVPPDSDSEDETLTKPSPSRIIPQVHYPSELGYCNGRGVEERGGRATSSKRKSPRRKARVKEDSDDEYILPSKQKRGRR